MAHEKIKKALAAAVIISFICTLSSEGFMYMFNVNDFVNGVSAAKVARIIFIGVMLLALVGRLIIENAYDEGNVVTGSFENVMSTSQSA